MSESKFYNFEVCKYEIKSISKKKSLKHVYLNWLVNDISAFNGSWALKVLRLENFPAVIQVENNNNNNTTNYGSWEVI